MSDNPSVHEANKVVRVLNGERLKFTCRLHYTDGRVLEWQSNTEPYSEWNEKARGIWVFSQQYNGYPITPFPEFGVLLCEENPKV